MILHNMYIAEINEMNGKYVCMKKDKKMWKHEKGPGFEPRTSRMLHREAPTEPEGTDSVGEREYSDWLTGQPQVSCSRSLPLYFAGHKVVTGGLLTSPLLSNLLTVWFGFTYVQFFKQIPIFFFSFVFVCK